MKINRLLEIVTMLLNLPVTIPEEEWLYGYILSFGSHAEVLEPEHIREIIKTRAKEILEIY